MQIKLFTIPIGDSGNALNEMNSFLRGNKILEVQNQLISNENGAYWCFCVKYIESILFSHPDSKTKVDYRTVLPRFLISLMLDLKSNQAGKACRQLIGLSPKPIMSYFAKSFLINVYIIRFDSH